MRKILCFWLIISILCMVMCMVPQVMAAEFYVTDATGFKDALNTTQNNGEDDLIYLATGIYEENFTYIAQDGKSLVIKGNSGTTTQDIIIDGRSKGAVFSLNGSRVGGSIIIEGLTIQNGSRSGLFVSLKDTHLDIILDHVVIQNNSNEYRGGGVYLKTNGNATLNIEIWNSIIRHNESPGQEDGGQGRGGGIYTYSYVGNSTINLLVVNSLIYKNRANWTGGGMEIAASEVGDNNVTRATVINSTITGNVSNMHERGSSRGGGIRVYAYRGKGTIVLLNLYNTIVYNNTSIGDHKGQDLFVGKRDPGEATVNAYFCNINDIDGDLNLYNPVNVINDDPRFSDPAHDDYHLTQGSPCIDVGTNTVPVPPGLPAIDFEGDLRILGKAPDIGADECK